METSESTVGDGALEGGGYGGSAGVLGGYAGWQLGVVWEPGVRPGEGGREVVSEGEEGGPGPP